MRCACLWAKAFNLLSVLVSQGWLENPTPPDRMQVRICANAASFQLCYKTRPSLRDMVTKKHVILRLFSLIILSFMMPELITGKKGY